MNQLNVDLQAILHAGNAFGHLHERALKALDEAQRSASQIKWEGPAGDQMREAYNAFISKYQERYLQMLLNYQDFLYRVVAYGYEETQKQNVNLSSLIDQSIGTCPDMQTAGLTGQAKDIVSDWVLNLK